MSNDVLVNHEVDKQVVIISRDISLLNRKGTDEIFNTIYDS